MKKLIKVILPAIFILLGKQAFSQTELLIDNDFETQNRGMWLNNVLPYPASSTNTGVIANVSAKAHSPSHYGCINYGRTSAFPDGNLAQELNGGLGLLANVTSAYLTFYYRMDGNTTTGLGDDLHVVIEEFDGLNPYTEVELMVINSNDVIRSNYFFVNITLTKDQILAISKMSDPILAFIGKHYESSTEMSFDDVHFKVGFGAPIVDFTSSDTIVNRGQPLLFYDQSIGTPTSYLWKFYDGSPQGYQTSTEQNTKYVYYDYAGTYNVSLTATNSIGTRTTTKPNYITVVANTGIQMNSSPTLSFLTYPNPIANILNLELKDDLLKIDSKLKICNQIGQVIIEDVIQKNTAKKQYDFSNLSSDIYFISITNADGNIITQKIVKE